MDFAHRPMQGFLYVNPKGCKTEASLRFWVEEAAGYALSQPPKVKGEKKAKLQPIQAKAMKKTKVAKKTAVKKKA